MGGNFVSQNLTFLLFYLSLWFAYHGVMAFTPFEMEVRVKPKSRKPCTIRSASSGTFFDLNQLTVPNNTPKKGGVTTPRSWQARGFDFPANFSINFCAPVVEELKNVVGVDPESSKNISAFYQINDTVYSLGNLNTEPVFRGRKLVLNYTNGSPCSESDPLSSSSSTSFHEMSKFSPINDINSIPRKATIISMLCDRDPLSPKVSVAYIGSLDNCSFFFEARSLAACGGIETAQQTLGPAGVFSVIASVAFFVYLVGGCVYQRVVFNQRGFHQLPNFTLWKNVWRFLSKSFMLFRLLLSRLLPNYRGYQSLPIQSTSRYQYDPSDDENRLIDQLEDDWDGR